LRRNRILPPAGNFRHDAIGAGRFLAVSSERKVGVIERFVGDPFVGLGEICIRSLHTYCCRSRIISCSIRGNATSV
jgi:hypothetical protein